MKKGRKTINPKKVAIVENTIKLISNYNVIGLANIKGFPASALQEIKMKLHGKAKIKVVRKKLLKFALEKTKKELLDHIPEQPALILTNENPFKIYKFIIKNKSACAAKPGDVAEEEIVVPAGPTDLMPGPAMTTLNSLKIKSKVEGGKISIIKDVTVAKKGDVISEQLASVLSMLKMKPMKIGLNIEVMLEDNTIYTKNVLHIDEERTIKDIMLAAQEAFNLSVEACYLTSENIEFVISKAFNEAKKLCVEAGILDRDFIGDVLAKAVGEANSLKVLVPETDDCQSSDKTCKNEEGKT